MALVVLRRTAPTLHRPYRAPLPCVLICMVSAVSLIGSTLVQQPLPTLAALGLVSVAWPARWAWQRSERGKRLAQPTGAVAE